MFFLHEVSIPVCVGRISILLDVLGYTNAVGAKMKSNQYLD
jgi:hypothetical protein